MAYKNPEVIKHFPPQYIIGKQVDDLKEIAVEEHELVTVKLYEVKNEWMYSNPTGMFNLSLPDKAVKNANYRIITYQEHKESLAENNDAAAEKAPEPEYPINTTVFVDPLLLRVEVLNKVGKTLKVGINIKKDGEEDANVRLPVGGIKVKVFSGMTDASLAGILQKINPTKPFGKFTLEIEAQYAVKSFSKSNINSDSADGVYVTSGVGTGTSTWNDNYAEAVSHQGTTGNPFFVTGSSMMNQGRRQGIS